LFGGVRLRTDVAQAHAPPRDTLYLVFKIAPRVEHSWRPLNGGLTTMTLLAGSRLVDGVYEPSGSESTRTLERWR
jgi:hypothetical protein